MMEERTIGEVLEGIRNLNERYTCQEGRLTAVEKSIAGLHGDFLGQQFKCAAVFEQKFASKESLKPIEEVVTTIKKTAIYIFGVLLTVVVGMFIYIERTT